MATFSSLASLKSKQESFDKAQAERNRPKANWFSPRKDGKPVRIQFLQELDPEAENFNPKNGTFLGAVEHQAPGPKGYLARALDTTETDPEGRDFAAEMHEKYPTEGWRARENFYINVAVEQPDGSVRAEIMSRNLNSAFVKTLVRKFERSKGRGITGVTYDIWREGSGPQTQWILEESEEDIDITGVELWNLEEYAVRHVPYEKQREFYMRHYEKPDGGDKEDTSAFNGGGSEESRQEPASVGQAQKKWDW